MVLQRICREASNLLVALEGLDRDLVVSEAERLSVVLQILAVYIPGFDSCHPALVFVRGVNLEAARVIFVVVCGCIGDSVRLEQGPYEIIRDCTCFEHRSQRFACRRVIFIDIAQEKFALRNLLLEALLILRLLRLLQLWFESLLDEGLQLLVVVKKCVRIDLRCIFHKTDAFAILEHVLKCIAK